MFQNRSGCFHIATLFQSYIFPITTQTCQLVNIAIYFMLCIKECCFLSIENFNQKCLKNEKRNNTIHCLHFGIGWPMGTQGLSYAKIVLHYQSELSQDLSLLKRGHITTCVNFFPKSKIFLSVDQYKYFRIFFIIKLLRHISLEAPYPSRSWAAGLKPQS